MGLRTGSASRTLHNHTHLRCLGMRETWHHSRFEGMQRRSTCRDATRALLAGAAPISFGEFQSTPDIYPLGDDVRVLNAAGLQERANHLHSWQLGSLAPKEVLHGARWHTSTLGKSPDRRVARPDLHSQQTVHEFAGSLCRHRQRRRAAQQTEPVFPGSSATRARQSALGHRRRNEPKELVGVFPAHSPVVRVPAAGLNVRLGDFPGGQFPTRRGYGQGRRRKPRTGSNLAKGQRGMLTQQP
jgi:hypothetical protein